MKRRPTEQEKTYVNHIFNKWLISTIYKELYTCIAKTKQNKKTQNSIKNRGSEQTLIPNKTWLDNGYYQKVKKYRVLARMWRERNTCPLLGGTVNWCSHYKTVWKFFKN